MAADLDGLRIDRDKVTGGGRTGLWIGLAFVIGIAAGGAGVFLFFPRGDSGPAPRAVEVSAVRAPGSGPAPGKTLFTAGGWIEPAFPYPKTVSSLIRGRIEKIHVQDGQAVKAGEVIAEIYARDFEEELLTAKAQLEVLKKKHEVDGARLALLEAGYRKQDIDEARAKLRELSSEVELWKEIAGRSEKLAADGAVSVEQAQTDRATLETKKARYDGHKATLARLEEGVRSEEIAHQRSVVDRGEALVAEGETRVRIAETNLEYTVIRSPLDSVVLRSFREIGDYVNPVVPVSSRIVWLYDPAKVWARVDVAQSNLALVKIGAPVEVRIDAAPRGYPGRVVRKDPYGSLAKNTVEVKVEITGPDAMLHPEMTSRITFLASSQGPAGPAVGGHPTVPAGAFFEEGGKTFVFVVEDDRVRKTLVTIGERKGDVVEVVSGLKPLQLVVTSDPSTLSDGQVVSMGGSEKEGQ